MENRTPHSHLRPVFILGSVWGLSEAALGMGLRSCASLVSGSLMTGVALFFIAASWTATRRVIGIALLVIIASLFKMFDAILLSLPIRHGSIGNPIFAFFMEGIAFLILIMIFKSTLNQKRSGQALLGGTSALVAVGLYPLVRFATGIPACVYPGTSIPLSIYFAPLAIVLSAFTVPLGFWAGEKSKAIAIRSTGANPRKTMDRFVSPAAFIFCLALVAFIRLF